MLAHTWHQQISDGAKNPVLVIGTHMHLVHASPGSFIFHFQQGSTRLLVKTVHYQSTRLLVKTVHY